MDPALVCFLKAPCFDGRGTDYRFNWFLDSVYHDLEVTAANAVSVIGYDYPNF